MTACSTADRNIRLFYYNAVEFGTLVGDIAFFRPLAGTSGLSRSMK
jgi:hypothetical protein